jgi:hypothetical protein
MNDIKLFRTTETGVAELSGGAIALEKSLQTLIERNMEAFLGVRFRRRSFQAHPPNATGLGGQGNRIWKKMASPAGIENRGQALLIRIGFKSHLPSIHG